MAATYKADFEKNVFINCPFDDDYTPLLQALLFTIIYFGFNPRIASERADSGEQRVAKICELIYSSKYSIHDLSRLKSKEADEFYRLNMPFELGIDYGLRYFSTDQFKDKKFIILEKDKFQYSIALSDLAGIDIRNHSDEPILVVRVIRYWLAQFIEGMIAPPAVVWDKFNYFQADFYEERKKEGFSADDLYSMPVSEYIVHIRRWLEEKSDPIAPGLNSAVKITGGYYINKWSNIPNAKLEEFNFSIIKGEILRDDKRKLVGNIVIRSPVSSAQQVIEKIGADKDSYQSEDSYISQQTALIQQYSNHLLNLHIQAEQ